MVMNLTTSDRFFSSWAIIHYIPHQDADFNSKLPMLSRDVNKYDYSFMWRSQYSIQTSQRIRNTIYLPHQSYVNKVASSKSRYDPTGRLLSARRQFSVMMQSMDGK